MLVMVLLRDLVLSWFVVLKVLVLVDRSTLKASGTIPVCGRSTGSSTVQSLLITY